MKHARIKKIQIQTFGEFEHELKTTGRSEIDARSVQFVSVDLVAEIRAHFHSFVHRADFHGAAGQFEAVQLFQRTFSVLRMVELEETRHHDINDRELKC
ncbi:unnamed protein product [Nesidiocoris tenuis]|uniref:Uncharacterized protein n=1 Tax=Nesidiocoris tenuis TaxID=355587 RepID=A0A6H5GDZ8_9HEMI|nr:unnamed protein product [Nesidiocoris tenuis]